MSNNTAGSLNLTVIDSSPFSNPLSRGSAGTENKKMKNEKD